jgi:phosphatidylglycerol:prolipoprotein diacylglycerol transferase
MLPVLINLKFLKIYTFGVFLVLSFFWGSFMLWKNIRLTSFKEEDVFDGLFTALFGSLLLGRLIYVILNFDQFGFDFLKFILINGYPGISLFGALIGGLVSLWLYFTFKRASLREAVDYFISPLLLAVAFGKLGSFFSGVEAGTKTKILPAVRYVGFDGARHLTPFYEAILFFAGAYLAQKLLFEVRREKYFHGFVFVFFGWYFSLINFLFDKLKEHNLYFLGKSFNGLLAKIILLTSSLYFIYYYRSSILKGLLGFTSFLKTYEQKAFKKIRHEPGTKTKR